MTAMIFKLRASPLINFASIVFLMLASGMVQSRECTGAKVVYDYLNVRSGPGTNHRKIGRLDQGESYVVHGESGDWKKIWLNQGSGWVSAISQYVQPVSQTCGRVINTSEVNVRSGPSTDYRLVGKAVRNSEWVIIGQVGVWHKVWYDGNQRWIHGYYLDTRGSTPQPDPISVADFRLNNDDASTQSRFVVSTQTIHGSNATHYQISEQANFESAQWTSFNNEIDYTLSADYGLKTVYFRVKNAQGRISETVSDSIELLSVSSDDRQIDPRVFFSEFRNAFGVMSQGQVDGINFILDNMQADKEAAYKNLPVYIRQMAYLWATIKHEVANTYSPITEYGDSFCSDYDGGCLYKGRGYVQLTHRYNYQAMSPVVNLDLVTGPEKALIPDVAYQVMSYGSFHGVFTTRKLGSYIKSGHTDYYNARRVINGTDKAALIAGYAGKFQNVMEKSTR